RAISITDGQEGNNIEPASPTPLPAGERPPSRDSEMAGEGSCYADITPHPVCSLRSQTTLSPTGRGLEKAAFFDVIRYLTISKHGHRGFKKVMRHGVLRLVFRIAFPARPGVGLWARARIDRPHRGRAALCLGTRSDKNHFRRVDGCGDAVRRVVRHPALVALFLATSLIRLGTAERWLPLFRS